MKIIKFETKGFNLIEIVISIAVISILAVLLISSFLKTDDKKVLETEARNIQAILDEAKSKALLGDSGSKHGVHFATTTVTSFVGNSYTQGASTNVVINLGDRVTISSISLNGGGSDVVFEKLTGETNNYGSIVLDNKLSTTTVSISKSGFVDIDE